MTITRKEMNKEDFLTSMKLGNFDLLTCESKDGSCKFRQLTIPKHILKDKNFNSRKCLKEHGFDLRKRIGKYDSPNKKRLDVVFEQIYILIKKEK